MQSGGGRRLRATGGDLNAFFALFLDNAVNLFILAMILTGFGLPKEFIYTKMIPGTAMGSCLRIWPILNSLFGL